MAELRSRNLLLSILVGALLGSALGAGGLYVYAHMFGLPSLSAANTNGDGAAQYSPKTTQQLAEDMAAMRVELAQLRMALGVNGFSANVAVGDSAATDGNDAMSESDPQVLDDAFLDRVAQRMAKTKRSRYAQPDYEKSMQRLSEAGFSAYDAEQIFAIEAEAQLRFMDIMSDPGMRNRETIQQVIAEFSESLHGHLGDYGYENYLTSRGLPTSVEVMRIDNSSTAANIGLKQGDEIVSYAGKRVFNIQNLSGLVDARTGGGAVSMEIIRDGQRQQVTVPSGKIGISARPFSPRAIFDLRPAPAVGTE